MPLPNVNIKLENGALGRVAGSSDGIAGLILSGAAVADKLNLNQVYLISATRDLISKGVTEENNPLVYKEVSAFYAQAKEGAELYLIVVPEAMTFTQMCAVDAGSPLKKLIDFAKGRIRLVGMNRIAPAEYVVDTATTGVDADVIGAAALAQAVASSYEAKINPFRVLLPAFAWDGETENLFKPREGSTNRVGFVLAADKIIGGKASVAIGQVLGRAALIPVNYSIARVRSGAIAVVGFMSSGVKPEEVEGLHDLLNDAGYIFYRNFVGKNGYYLNDDCMSAPLSDDYSALSLGRVIDKAILYAYSAYIDEIQDSIEVDDDGYLPQYLCTHFEDSIKNVVGVAMQNEISSFSAYVDPKQNVLSSSQIDVVCRIVPKGILKELNVSLGFDNPAK